MAKTKSNRIKVQSAEAKAQAAERQAHWDLLAKLPFWRVPEGEKSHSYWGLPARGEYEGGCTAGRASATAYLKYLRESRSPLDGVLQRIVLDMLERATSSDSLRGQVVGFFRALDRWLQQYAQIAEKLDRVSFEDLQQEVNRGLAHTKADEEAAFKAVAARTASRAAKRGWATRRANQKRRPRLQSRGNGRAPSHRACSAYMAVRA